MRNPFRVVGRKTTLFFEDLGGIALLIKNILLELPGSFKRFHLTTEQMLFMGVNSLPLILVTSVFTGGVASVQSAYMFSDYVPMRYLGTAVGKTVIMELGPVLTALVVGGRVGASIAAELGTMKVTEQIDALESLAINPGRYLVVPRFVGAIGGYVVGVTSIGVSTHTYVMGLKDFFYLKDLYSGLIKSFVFGGIIAT